MAASPAIAQRICAAQLELAKRRPDQAAVLLEHIPDSSLSLDYEINLTRAEIALADRLVRQARASASR